MVAWTSWRDGPPEIYLASTDGGAAERVSYWSNNATRLHGWSPAGELLATTAAGQPFGHYTWAYAIPVADGEAQFARQRRLPFGPAANVAIDGDGTVALLTSSYQDPAFWKRYRGGTSGRLWVSTGVRRTESGTGFRRLQADLAGQFHSPMLVGGRLAFLSDFEGTGNIYSCALDGSDLRRHTDHDGIYARNASTDGARIVYQCGGEIWLLADLAADSEPARIQVSLGAPVAGPLAQLMSADDHLDGLCCDHTGRASAVQVRGTVHWLTHSEGPGAGAVRGRRPGRQAAQGARGHRPGGLGRGAKEGDAIEIAPAEGVRAGGAAQADRIRRDRLGRRAGRGTGRIGAGGGCPRWRGCCSSMSPPARSPS